MATNIKTDYDATKKADMQFNGNPVYTKVDANNNIQVIKTGETVIMTKVVFDEMLEMLKHASKQDSMVRDFFTKYTHVFPFALVRD